MSSLLLPVVTVLAAARGSLAAPLALAVTAGLCAAMLGERRRKALLAVIVLSALASLAAWRGTTELEALGRARIAPYTGWVTVVADPDRVGASTRVIVDVEGQRFELWARGRARQLRVGEWRAGDVVWTVGTRRALGDERAARVAWQHVVGRFDPDVLGDRRAGARLAVATNRVRAHLAAGTATLGPVHAALADGLIYGDDSAQPVAMVERFRASGLAHLVAVSGQNVHLVLAIAGPLLRRLRPAPRLFATVAVIGWFVLLTRAEPSILRAGVMAMLAALAFATGRDRAPLATLCAAVSLLVVVDPLIVRSIGFWMSVGATTGVVLLTEPLQRRLRRWGPVALPLGATLAAQAGVTPVIAGVFGVPQSIGVVANVLAVPVASFVMLYGLPAAILAGVLVGRVPVAAELVMTPVAVAVRWVDGVAAVTARMVLPPPANLAAWAVVVAGVVVAGRSTRRRGRPRRGRGS